MTPPKRTSTKSIGKQGGTEKLRKLQNEARELVPEYDEIDVQITKNYRRESPRGTAVRILTWSSVALLTLIGLYGMIAHDREILLATLKAAQVIMVAVAAGVLGKTVTRLLARGSNRDEENEDSG